MSSVDLQAIQRDYFPHCTLCAGFHAPDQPGARVDFKGRRYRPPFACLCCGKAICAPQFAFGRACAFCDTGRCGGHAQISSDQRQAWLERGEIHPEALLKETWEPS